MGEPNRWQDAPDGHDAVLRIFEPVAARGGLGEPSLELTLSEFWRSYYKPVVMVARDAAPRNLEEIEQTVKYWCRFTGDPPLGEITVYHARDFIVGLKSLPGRRYATLANNTVRKHAAAVQAMLDLCGPASRENREGLGLFVESRVPYIPRPPKDEPAAEDSFTFDELARLVENADAARLPDSLPCSAGTYLRRLYVLLFNTTMRIGGLMSATWRNYHGDHLLLAPKFGVKGRKWQRVELNEAAQAIVESMRGFDAERIFPWPRSWPASRHQLYDQHDLVKVVLAPERQFAFHAVRKLSNMEIARINPKACEKALGHSSGRVNVEHYTSRVLVAETLSKMPRLPTARMRQRTLFD